MVEAIILMSGLIATIAAWWISACGLPWWPGPEGVRMPEPDDPRWKRVCDSLMFGDTIAIKLQFNGVYIDGREMGAGSWLYAHRVKRAWARRLAREAVLDVPVPGIDDDGEVISFKRRLK